MQQIAILSGLTEWATSDALSALQRRDLVIVEQGDWRIVRPLFKRWLQIDGRQVTSRNEESDEDQSGTRIAD
jgi:virulence-associated protein VagC